ncbi:putative membrane protein [Halobacteriovorax marinus SJ]|uniref:Membrane protein n=1 Tax=Halobacteriovorax marinus (strain ATCC BAA-682 / DSM 15412 / SJ) TaxID=862908 RepID=E1X5T4_HALMS|nr:hypothetical protein [Halobacteriovorax marinus]CBW25651.1 putative membrane protein [Halobacteriovorax marinus SJ]
MNKNIVIASLLFSIYGSIVGHFLGAQEGQAMVSFVGFFISGLIFSKITKRVFNFPLEIIVMVVLFPVGILLGYSSLLIFNILLIVALQVVVKHLRENQV